MRILVGAIIKYNIYVDLEKIKRQLENIKRKTKKRILFMLKADAYGHGICEVGLKVQSVCDMFGVATLEEGLVLRHIGINKDILVANLLENEFDSAIENNFIISISSCHQLNNLCQSLTRYELQNQVNISSQNMQVRLHIKLDTGMHRLGIEEDEIDCILKISKKYNLSIEGVYSHLRKSNQMQLDNFIRMSSVIINEYPDAIRHLGSSNTIGDENFHFDMLRIGYLGYKDCLYITSQVIANRFVRAGEYVGYGDFKVESDTNIALVFGGYYDGVELLDSVVIKGKKCKIIGRVSMDMFCVETKDFFAENGEICYLVLPETINTLTEKEIASSFEYRLMTAFKGRAQRIYFDYETTSEIDG